MVGLVLILMTLLRLLLSALANGKRFMLLTLFATRLIDSWQTLTVTEAMWPSALGKFDIINGFWGFLWTLFWVLFSFLAIKTTILGLILLSFIIAWLATGVINKEPPWKSIQALIAVFRGGFLSLIALFYLSVFIRRKDPITTINLDGKRFYLSL